MSKGVLQRAADALRKRKDKRDTKLDEIMERTRMITSNGETEDDDSKRPQGKDVRR